jgi:uncharacterized protein YkwD
MIVTNRRFLSLCPLALAFAAAGCNSGSADRETETATSTAASAGAAGAGAGLSQGPSAVVANVGDPTPDEQELIELINRARLDPVAEGQRLGLDFSAYAPREPLAPAQQLARAALGHTDDMIRRGFYGHLNPDGVNANGRIMATGYPLHPLFGTNPAGNMTESIGVGSGAAFDTPQEVHDTFMIDAGFVVPKHRNAILGHGDHFGRFRQVGIGYRVGQASPGQPWEYFCTEEFAVTTTDRPFVTGVVFDDPDGDGLCRAGEGRGGVAVELVDAAGATFTAQTASAGAYAFEILRDGVYTVRIAGQSVQVAVRGESVKIDAKDGALVGYGAAVTSTTSPAGAAALAAASGSSIPTGRVSSPVRGASATSSAGVGSRFWYEGDAFGNPLERHSVSEQAFADAIVAELNAARAQNGLPPLAPDADAQAAGKAHSEVMQDRGYFAHRSPEGWGVADRLRLLGASGVVTSSENIFQGLSDPSRLVAAWLGSPGHRQNILSPTATHVGIGVRGGASPLVTAVFLQR